MTSTVNCMCPRWVFNNNSGVNLDFVVSTGRAVNPTTHFASTEEGACGAPVLHNDRVIGIHSGTYGVNKGNTMVAVDDLKNLFH